MFNNSKYLKDKRDVQQALDNGTKPFDFMMKYKQCITDEDYETAKAITECLKPLNYDTNDTHQHIEVLNAT